MPAFQRVRDGLKRLQGFQELIRFLIEHREEILSFLALLAQIGVLFAAAEAEEKQSGMAGASGEGPSVDPAGDTA